MHTQEPLTSSTSSPPPPLSVPLTSDQFETALARYIDYYKPDPLCRKQLEEWSLEWKPSSTQQKQQQQQQIKSDSPKHQGGQAVTPSSSSSPTSLPMTNASHQIKGTLEIGGEYLVVMLHIVCMWKHYADYTTSTTSSSSSDASGKDESQQTQRQKPEHGELFFSCSASTRFWTKKEIQDRNRRRKKQTDITSTIDNNDDSDINKDKSSSVQKKIRSKMVSRLRQDAYISKILVTPPKDSPSAASLQGVEENPSTSLLAQARIQFGVDDIEERVTVSEDVCEAIKRAIWSSVDSPLDVVEVIMNLPFLPTTDHSITAAPTTTSTTTTTTTTLANRAKLRLLEDAMCDACEKEGEEEILEELQITEKKQKR